MTKLFILLIITGVFYFSVMFYVCGFNICTQSIVVVQPELAPFTANVERSEFESHKRGKLTQHKFNRSDIGQTFELDLEEKDVIVFLQMQKTGGTVFGTHLAKDIDVEPPCKCHWNVRRCDCYTGKGTVWLFSGFSTNWACGLHADWTKLKACVEKAMNRKEKKERHRRYHYITMLRDPVKRYISEWKHVQRGATWKDAKLFCNGRSPTSEELPPCYNSNDWRGVALDEFLHCRYNLARNRQTRMMADLTLVNCYNTTGQDTKERDQIMLKSAKENLLRMAYFGLTEFQHYSQNLFEHTFNLQFKVKFEQSLTTRSDKENITEIQKYLILEKNKLDIELYAYAKDLFLQRVSANT